MSLPSVLKAPAGAPRDEENLHQQQPHRQNPPGGKPHDDGLREAQGEPQEAREHQLVRAFLEYLTPRSPGFFVDVGANHPWRGSQTWHLEQRGWRGIVVEPLPEHADHLRRTRTAAVFEVACSSPENAGKVLPFYAADVLSGLDLKQMAPSAEPCVINVPVRTLDSALKRRVRRGPSTSFPSTSRGTRSRCCAASISPAGRRASSCWKITSPISTAIAS